MAKKENSHKIITVLNPSSFGVKYSGKAQYYFQFRNDLLHNPQVFSLSNDAKILFLSILAESSRVGNDTISMCLEYCCGLLRVPLGCIKGLLRELEHNDIIELEIGVRVPINKRKEKNIKEKNIKEKKRELVKNQQHPDTSGYDFETPYKTHYPRKGAGKSKGMDTLAKNIKTDQDYRDFCTAIENYSLEMRAVDTETKYIKIFSTFTNCWRDYLEISDDAKSLKTGIDFLEECKRLQKEHGGD